MATFTDNKDREWEISLDAPTIRMVREEADIDLASLDGSAYEKLDADPILLVDTLWLLCKSQAKEHGVTSSQFGESLVGEAIDRATEALLKAIVGFFPKRRGEVVDALAKKKVAMEELAVERVLKELDDPELMEKLKAKLDADVKQSLTQLFSATNSPESSESTPPA